MMRLGVHRLQISAASELFRLCGGNPPSALWHSSAVLTGSKRPKDSKKKSSASSDSDSDTEKGFAVDPQLQKAAETVAKSVPGEETKVKSDLLQQLQSFAKLSTKQAAGENEAAGTDSTAAAVKLNTLLSGMQIQKGRGKQHDGDDRGESFGGKPFGGKQFGGGKPFGEKPFGGKPFEGRRQQQGIRRLQPNPDREKVKLFDGPALGIFTAADTDSSAPKVEEQAVTVTESTPGRVSLWERVQREQLSALSNQPPTNAFEEMIQWTQDGKLWQYPINNEQGMDEEASIGFHQHVFLEDQIQDFPRRGPIRHFMELVLVGLQKNPYLTVQQKHEHIDWFRQYFKEKRDVLEEALGPDGLIAEPKEAKEQKVAKKRSAAKSIA